MIKNLNLALWLSTIPLVFTINFAKENPSIIERFYSGLIYPWFFKIHQFFFQAEDGIRDPEMSRGLGDVYKRQVKKVSLYRQLSKALLLL